MFVGDESRAGAQVRRQAGEGGVAVAETGAADGAGCLGAGHLPTVSARGADRLPVAPDFRAWKSPPPPPPARGGRLRTDCSWSWFLHPLNAAAVPLTFGIAVSRRRAQPLLPPPLSPRQPPRPHGHVRTARAAAWAEMRLWPAAGGASPWPGDGLCDRCCRSVIQKPFKASPRAPLPGQPRRPHGAPRTVRASAGSASASPGENRSRTRSVVGGSGSSGPRIHGVPVSSQFFLRHVLSEFRLVFPADDAS
ncbi:uncharacterized protein LOC111729096 [Pteropus vampyrus]|uniref:Uncharacterized protein LOC111729096 n=1 Tax=Pteropus vampyrus TaxID=132908 RepID=A0A6P6BLB4_PTEVA|nr:uncharacterized protein LOC111729096 [Pteropus vampyrus]